MKQSYPDFFNDVFGPIMQPFSSSHTAAPCRIGYLTNSLLDEPVKKIRIYTGPNGSFASSMKMMNVDLALLSGSTGHLPDNKIMFEMPEYCKREGIDWEIILEDLPETPHHSSARIVLTGESGKTVSLTANSTGGGVVETVVVNGYPLAVKGDGYVVLLYDAAGLDEGAMEQKLGLPLLDKGRAEADGKTLLWYATAEEVTVDKARSLTGHADVAVLKPVQAVIYKPDRKPQLFDSFTKWKQLAEEQGKELWELAVQYEMDSSGWSHDEVVAYMRDVVMVKMYRTSHALLEEDITPKETPFTGHFYKQWAEYSAGPTSFVEGAIAKAGAYALAAQVPVPGIEFVPAPMGAGGGLLFSGMSGVKETKGYSDEEMLKGLFVAAGVGAVCFTRTDPGGVNIGCAGEQGMCSAMSSAGIVTMAGGTPDQVESAASYCMQISVGWPCEPTPGAKNMPCYARAFTGVVMAICFAQLALAGRGAVFPLDEAIDVADNVGRQLPSDLRGTSKGSFAGCPTGRACTKAFNEWNAQNS